MEIIATRRYNIAKKASKLRDVHKGLGKPVTKFQGRAAGIFEELRWADRLVDCARRLTIAVDTFSRGVGPLRDQRVQRQAKHKQFISLSGLGEFAAREYPAESILLSSDLFCRNFLSKHGDN